MFLSSSSSSGFSCLTATMSCWPRNLGVLSGSFLLMYLVNRQGLSLLPKPSTLLHTYSHHPSQHCHHLTPKVKSWPCPSHPLLHMLRQELSNMACLLSATLALRHLKNQISAWPNLSSDLAALLNSLISSPAILSNYKYRSSSSNNSVD